MKKIIFSFLTFILVWQIFAVGCIGADNAREKIVVIKGAIAAGTDEDLTAFLAAHLADDAAIPVLRCSRGRKLLFLPFSASCAEPAG
ncbi:MAG: hypothetical protein ACYC9M_01590 [Desulfobulbaceae bacterium]